MEPVPSAVHTLYDTCQVEPRRAYQESHVAISRPQARLSFRKIGPAYPAREIRLGRDSGSRYPLFALTTSSNSYICMEVHDDRDAHIQTSPSQTPVLAQNHSKCPLQSTLDDPLPHLSCRLSSSPRDSTSRPLATGETSLPPRATLSSSRQFPRRRPCSTEIKLLTGSRASLLVSTEMTNRHGRTNTFPSTSRVACSTLTDSATRSL